MKPARHLASPQASSRPEFGDLFKKVVVDVEEEGELRGEPVHRKTSLHGSFHVSQAVVQGEGQFLHRRRTGFTDVVSADTHWVPFRNVLGTIGNGVGD